MILLILVIIIMYTELQGLGFLEESQVLKVDIM